jgi:predicted Holliday junction resolvase-like endonuclease
LAPIFKVFGYNPSDARFIGDPVDYVIFDGYTKVRERIEDIPITVVLADVKTGDADLTYEQRRIKQVVKFEVIRL